MEQPIFNSNHVLVISGKENTEFNRFVDILLVIRWLTVGFFFQLLINNIVKDEVTGNSS